MGIAFLIIASVLMIILIWKMIKPYTIKYDTTLFVCGGLGSGKTLTQVKIATTLLRKARLSWYINNVIQLKVINHFRKKHNKRVYKYNEKHENKKSLKELLVKTPKPQIYSNIPINFKPHIWSSKKKREWTCKLRKEHILLTLEMAQHSIVLIDELPQLVNQFNWDIEEVQNNVNEFITYFRHYINGYVLCNAQSIDDVVVQIRRKGNTAIWCYDFHRHLFGLFYSIRMCDMMLSDEITSTSSSFVEENTRVHYGLFPPKDTYDSRCYSERYKNILQRLEKRQKRWNKLKTNKVLRIENKVSVLDDDTTKQQKEAVNKKMLNKEDLKENKD